MFIALMVLLLGTALLIVELGEEDTGTLLIGTGVTIIVVVLLFALKG